MTLAQPQQHQRSIISILVGGFLIVVGGLVIVGWYTHNLYLVQIYPTFTPMQYNTALCFILSGFGILAFSFDRTKFTLLLMSIIGVFGLLTLIEYIFGLNLNIDQLFIKPFTVVKTSHSGRMSPITATCFFLTALCFFYASSEHESKIWLFFGVILLAIACSAILSYVLSIETIYGFGALTRMAVHTAICFAAIGVSFIIPNLMRKTPQFLSAFVLFIGLIIAFQALQFLNHLEEKRFKTEFEYDSNIRVGAIKKEVQFLIQIVNAVKAFYDGSQEVDRNEFATFTKLGAAKHQLEGWVFEWVPLIRGVDKVRFEEVIRTEGFFQFEIKEITTQGQFAKAGPKDEYFPVLYAEPYQSNSDALGIDHSSLPERLDIIQKARDSGTTLVTGATNLVRHYFSGKPGFLLLAPVYEKENVQDSVSWRRQHLVGFVDIICDFKAFIDRVLSYTKPLGLDIHLYDELAPAGSRFLYYHPAQTRKPWEHIPIREDDIRSLTGFYYSEIIEFGGGKWRVLCTPTPQYLKSYNQWVSWGAFLTILLITLPLSFYLYMLSHHSIELVKTQELLKIGEEQNRLLIENIPHMIFVKDAKDLKFVRFNQAGEELLGVTRETMIGKNDHDFFPTAQANFFIQKDKEVLEGKKIVDIPEETIDTKSKGRRVLHTKKVPILDHEGNPLYVLGISEDITERKMDKEDLLAKTKELEEEKNRLERYQNLSVDREFVMVRLKEEVNTLLLELGKNPKYQIPDPLKQKPT